MGKFVTVRGRERREKSLTFFDLNKGNHIISKYIKTLYYEVNFSV